MSEYADLIVHWLTHGDGGRSSPVHVRGRGGSYKPHLRLHAEGEFLGVAFLDGEPPIVEPGGDGSAIVALIYEGNGVDYSALTPGVEFVVVEGLRVVGRGTVVRRWAADDDWRSRQGS